MLSLKYLKIKLVSDDIAISISKQSVHFYCPKVTKLMKNF